MWSQQVAQATQLSDLDLNQWHKYRQQQLGGELDCVILALGEFRSHWAEINQLNERNEFLLISASISIAVSASA